MKCSNCLEQFELAPLEVQVKRLECGGPICVKCQHLIGIGAGTKYPGINVGKGYMGRPGGQRGIARARKSGAYSKKEVAPLAFIRSRHSF
jgi:hypothetical protein